MEKEEMIERQKAYLRNAFDAFYAGRRKYEEDSPTDISVAEFARVVGVAPNTLYRLMRGDSLINLWNLLTLVRSPLVGWGLMEALLSEEEQRNIARIVEKLPDPPRDPLNAHS
jgi:hypothetical protein